MRSLVALLLACAGAALAGGLPDLRLDTGRLAGGISFEVGFFPPDACELQAADLCVVGPGTRKLLRFDVFAINQGTADLVLGVPDDTTLLPDGSHQWVYSACHQHYHFTTFARYELRRRGETTPVLTGQKRSFCVEDTQPAGATTARKYCCSSACGMQQGIQVGWGDLYPGTLKCQWIDITDGVEPGAYDLCVFLNTAGLLPDADPSNDAGCVPVTVDAAPARAPAPRVKIRGPRARTRGRVGRALRIAWQKRVRGAFQTQEVWFSRDDGQTWALLAGGDALGVKSNAYRWTVPADAVSEQARVRVVVWAKNPRNAPLASAGALQRGVAVSAPFRITP